MRAHARADGEGERRDISLMTAEVHVADLPRLARVPGVVRVQHPEPPKPHRAASEGSSAFTALTYRRIESGPSA